MANVNNKSVNTNQGFYAATLFLVWPLLALISAVKNHRQYWAKNLLWAFIAFYGFTFAIGSESEGTDILVYIEEFQDLHGQSLSISTAGEYFENSGEVDILRTFIAIVLSRFTDNAAILTLFYGIIFGFFFSRNMWYVLDRLEGNIKPITILLLVCFSLVVPIWNMNGFRFWTAAHIYIYGLLPFLFEQKKSGLFICSLSMLVHFAFLIPVTILVSYLLLGDRLKIYFVMFLISFVISEINLTAFNELIESYAPEIVQERTSGYRGEEYVETYREGAEEEGKVWYAVWYGQALKWSIMGFLVVLVVRGFTFFEDSINWKRLLAFTLLFYVFANLFSSLPSGGRFVSVANLSALALITLYVQNREHELFMQRFILLATPALFIFIIVSIRIGLLSMSATVFFGNPVLAVFLVGEHVSLNDVLRLFL